MCPFQLLLFIDVSRSGWGAHLQDLTAARIWIEEELNHHISVLKKVAQLTLTVFRDWIMGEYIVLVSENATLMACVKKQESTVSWVMSDLAQEILTWAEQSSS